MKIVADTHIHMYPCYDAGRALRNLFDNLGRLCPDGVKAVFLVERSDCNWFASIRDSDGPCVPGFAVRVCGERDCVVLCGGGDAELYLFAGRQIVTSERVEVLSLTSDTIIPDGQPARQVVAKILESGAVPVLGWAPGKWFFSRRPVVESLISEFGSRLLIGDTTLRPSIWPEPVLMRRAAGAGAGILAGSDPLPFPGEERWLGTYGSILEGSFDQCKPVSSIRAVLAAGDEEVVHCGKRSGPVDVARRLLHNALIR